MAPLVSVLVIAGTGRPYLSAALRSLQSQDMRDWEAIVVEACANPADTAYVQSQCSAVSDPRVHYFPYDAERGWPPHAARKWNWAQKRASGSLIAWLDDDDMKGPGWLAAMSAPLVGDPGLATTASAGDCVDKDGRYVGAAFGEPNLSRASLENGKFITTGQLIVRRSVIDSVSGFDEALACAEDYDFCLRIADRPWRFVPSVKCMKRDRCGNACYNEGVVEPTQAALRRIIAKQGHPYTCYACGGGFASPDESFVWFIPPEVDGIGFRNWHYGCAKRIMDRGAAGAAARFEQHDDGTLWIHDSKGGNNVNMHVDGVPLPSSGGKSDNERHVYAWAFGPIGALHAGQRVVFNTDDREIIGIAENGGIRVDSARAK